MVTKKKGKFGTKAEKRYGDGITMAAILSDKEEGDTSEKLKEPTKKDDAQNRKTVKPENRQNVKPKTKTTAKSQKPGKPIVEEGQGASTEEVPEKVEHTERHFYYFTEELTFEMINFMNAIKPREKNKNRLVRALLHMFFDKPKEEQERIYREALEKFKDKVG